MPPKKSKSPANGQKASSQGGRKASHADDEKASFQGGRKASHADDEKASPVDEAFTDQGGLDFDSSDAELFEVRVTSFRLACDSF